MSVRTAAPRFIRTFFKRARQFNHQDGLCCWCGEPMEYPLPILDRSRMDRPQAPSWEHIIPIKLGGTHAGTNLVLAHRICNARRGTDVSRIPMFAPATPRWLHQPEHAQS